MVAELSRGLMSGSELITLMAEGDKLSSEVRKDNRTTRQLAHEKNRRLLDERISLLQEQNEALSSSSWYQFAVGLVSNILNIATQVISFVLPPAAPLAQAANQAAQGGLNSASQLDPHSKKGRELGVSAEKAQKKANEEMARASVAEEHMKETEESARTIQNRLERAIGNLEASGESAVRR